MEFVNSKTKENLMAAFLGECAAHTRYIYYSDVAKNEGYEYISNIFKQTGENEKYHAKRFLEELNMLLPNEKVAVKMADYPIELAQTYDNLLASASGECEEGDVIYPKFAKEAKEEGFERIASYFSLIAKVEKFHHERFKTLANEFKNDFFTRKEDVTWECLKCGYHHIGKSPLPICPICSHKKGNTKILGS